MKIICNREQFLSVFQTAAVVAPARSPKVILQNVKLDVLQDTAILTATDMEIGIRVDVPGIEVEQPGSAVIPVSRFGAILRESTDEKLVIETTDQGTSVQGQHSQFKLPGNNPDEFPAVATFDESDYFEVSSQVFKALIRRTIFATDTESSRYALGGILLEMEDDKIVAVGTDGRRLAKMEGPLKRAGNPTAMESMTIVPTRSMQMVERMLADDDSAISLAVRSNDVLVRNEHGVVYTRLVEGRFPKWREVFPDREHAVKIDITVGPLFSALRQAAIVASEDSRGVDFTFGGGSLVMNITTADIGQSRVEIPISYEGEPITTTLDHRYVGDFLKVLDHQMVVQFDMESGDRATLCTTDDGYGYVIMPLSRDRD